MGWRRYGSSPEKINRAVVEIQLFNQLFLCLYIVHIDEVRVIGVVEPDYYKIVRLHHIAYVVGDVFMRYQVGPDSRKEP